MNFSEVNEKRRKACVSTIKSACDPGATRTPNQQNRNLSFYPLNYGTVSILQKYNQMAGFTTNWKNLNEMC